MVKEPLAGRVKTRLARSIGPAMAASAYRTMLGNVTARLAGSRRWQTLLAVAPDHALASPMLPSAVLRMRQGGGDLGQRLHHAACQAPPGPVVIIGTDVPEVTPGAIASAFRSLGSHDVVFGAALDGGYWLVGLKRRPRMRRIFDHVRWSSAHALADTKAQARDALIATIAPLGDIDDDADLKRLRTAVSRRVLPRA
jgi:rSAM/selenodomain-associated transferase 1